MVDPGKISLARLEVHVDHPDRCQNHWFGKCRQFPRDDRSSVPVIDRPRLGSAFPSETFKHPPSLQWTHALTLAKAFATRGQNLL